MSLSDLSATSMVAVGVTVAAIAVGSAYLCAGRKAGSVTDAVGATSGGSGPSSSSEQHRRRAAAGDASSSAPTSAAAPAGGARAGVKTLLNLTLGDVPPGTMQEVKIEGRGAILLAHTVGGKLSATSSKCPHYGAPLAKGVLAGDRLVCPWHGACFKAGTGDIEDGPVLEKLASYATSVEPGSGQIAVYLPAGGEAVPRSVTPHMCRSAAAGADGRTFVVLGAGPAAAAAMETLRSSGFGGRIVVLAKERELPYDRPKLSKNMQVAAADISLRKADFYAALGVEMRLGVEVIEVRPAAHEVVCADGNVVTYTKLLCATGGVPRRFLPHERFSTPGAGLRGVLALRSLADAHAIEAALEEGGGSACPVVIVGSSFIGMEAAAYLAMRGCVNVTVLGMEAVPFERVLGREVGGYMQALHASKGIAFRLGATASVKSFDAGSDPGAVASVTLNSFETLPARVVIIGAGIIPATEYLAGAAAAAAGIELAAGAPGGVRVNELLQTGDPDVYAAGDIAYFPYAHAPAGSGGGGGPLYTRIEHWDVAYDQGRAAARNMLAHAGGATPAAGSSSSSDAAGMAAGAAALPLAPQPYSGVPFFWTTSYGKNLRYAGHCHKYDRLVVHGSLAVADASFTAYYVAGDAVLAVATLNQDPQAAAAAELLRLHAMPSPAQLAAAGAFDLVEFLRARTVEAAAEAAAAAAGGGVATRVATRGGPGSPAISRGGPRGEGSPLHASRI